MDGGYLYLSGKVHVWTSPLDQTLGMVEVCEGGRSVSSAIRERAWQVVPVDCQTLMNLSLGIKFLMTYEGQIIRP